MFCIRFEVRNIWLAFSLLLSCMVNIAAFLCFLITLSQEIGLIEKVHLHTVALGLKRNASDDAFGESGRSSEGQPHSHL